MASVVLDLGISYADCGAEIQSCLSPKVSSWAEINFWAIMG